MMEGYYTECDLCGECVLAVRVTEGLTFVCDECDRVMERLAQDIHNET
jgi:hypothetical protein